MPRRAHIDPTHGRPPHTADEPGPGIGDKRCGEITRRKPDSRADKRQGEVLQQQHTGDEPGRGPNSLQQADAPGPLCQPAADDHCQAGNGEQIEERACDQQTILERFRLLGVGLAHVLPRPHQSVLELEYLSRIPRRWPGSRASARECS